MDDVDLVRRVTGAAAVLGLLREPLSFAAGSMHDGPLRGALSALGGLNAKRAAFDGLTEYWSRKYHVEANRRSNLIVSSMWESSDDVLGDIEYSSNHYRYKVVMGVPVGMNIRHVRTWVHTPAKDEDLIAHARASRWLFKVVHGDHGGLAKAVPDDHLPPSAVIERRTASIIKDIDSIPGCRAHLLWGPPGSGKSVAAKQIAERVTGSWARVCGEAAGDPSVWDAIEILRPSAIIIDDIDVAREPVLMAGLEKASNWARVIISTANVIRPDRDSEKPSEPVEGKAVSPENWIDTRSIRGAVIRRASYGAPIEYRNLSPEARMAIAPDVPDHLETSDLLARWQAELQRRTHRGVTQADVDELRALQALVGDR